MSADAASSHHCMLAALEYTSPARRSVNPQAFTLARPPRTLEMGRPHHFGRKRFFSSMM